MKCSEARLSNDTKYQHLYVIIEHEDGEPVPVSLEMLGEARRLMDNFNKRYSLEEKVIALVLGDICINYVKNSYFTEPM